MLDTRAYDDLRADTELSGTKYPLVERAISQCPWETTDHMGDRRYNYCTWCDGFVTAELLRDEMTNDREGLGRLVADYFGWAGLSQTTRNFLGADGWKQTLVEKRELIIECLTDAERKSAGL